MSSAFVREDIDEPERPGLRRPASGLPPGAMNLMTAEGAQRLRELALASEGDPAELAHLQDTLASATIITPQPHPGDIVFGSRVTVRKTSGEMQTFRIVGVDEVHLEPGNVSWVSPLGKALLSAQVGKALRMPPENQMLGTVVAVG